MPDRLKLFRELNTALNEVLDKSDSRKNEDLMAQMVDYQRVSQLRYRQASQTLQHRDLQIKWLGENEATLRKEIADLRESRTHATLKAKVIDDQARGIKNQNKLIADQSDRIRILVDSLAERRVDYARTHKLAIELRTSNIDLRSQLQRKAGSCDGWLEATVINQQKSIDRMALNLTARRKQYDRKVEQVNILGMRLEDQQKAASVGRIRADQDRKILDNIIISLRSDLRETARLASPGRLPSTRFADLRKIHEIATKG